MMKLMGKYRDPIPLLNFIIMSPFYIVLLADPHRSELIKHFSLILIRYVNSPKNNSVKMMV